MIWTDAVDDSWNDIQSIKHSFFYSRSIAFVHHCDRPIDREKKTKKNEPEKCVPYLRRLLCKSVNRNGITFFHWNVLFEHNVRFEWHCKMVTNTINYTYLKGYILKLNRTSTCLPFSRLFFLILSFEFCRLICSFESNWIGESGWKKVPSDQTDDEFWRNTMKNLCGSKKQIQCSRKYLNLCTKKMSQYDSGFEWKKRLVFKERVSIGFKRKKVHDQPKMSQQQGQNRYQTKNVRMLTLCHPPHKSHSISVFFRLFFVFFHLNSLYDYYYC